MKERLDKFIASQTALSRKEVQRAVKDKRVTLNGSAVKSADVKIDALSDSVALDGAVITYKENVYYMLNKPSGVVSATEDRVEKTVIDILPPELRRAGLFPAGRLDKDTTGLLIITDDGDYAHRMLSPNKHVVKSYTATLDKEPQADIVTAFARGVTLADGTVCKSAEARLTGGFDVSVEISEGKYHQVKRMFAALGYHVEALRRVRIGSLGLDESLREGDFRELSPDEAMAVFG